MKTKILTHKDIRDVCKSWTSVIMRDQIFADGLSGEILHPQYDDHMWRTYRLDHLAFLNELSATVNTIPSAMLKRLTEIATGESPFAINQIAIEVLAECASGCAPREDVSTAALFFGRLIHEYDFRAEAASNERDAKASMFLWLAAIDPLRIGRDPECGYVPAAGSAY